MFDDPFLIVAAAVKLLYAAVAVLLLVGILRLWDRANGAPFRDVMQRTVLRDARAAALYFGLRLVGLGLLVGLLIGCAPGDEAAEKPEIRTAAPAVSAPAAEIREAANQAAGQAAGQALAASARFGGRYDRAIERAVERYWPAYPYPAAWKAQLWQESRLDPRAVSPAGARGLAQFMPATWTEVARALRYPPDASPHGDLAIEAGAFYMGRLRAEWASPRPAADRHQLAQASYNAGLGHLLTAQRRCGGALLYAAIVACLPAVTGRHSAETIGYVERIAHWRALIEAGV